MDSNTPAVIASAMTTATLTQGFMLFVTQNATFITTSSIAVTSFVGVVSFIWGKFNDNKRLKIESRRVDVMAATNRINKRNIIESAMQIFDKHPNEKYTAEEIKEKFRDN